MATVWPIFSPKNALILSLHCLQIAANIIIL